MPSMKFFGYSNLTSAIAGQVFSSCIIKVEFTGVSLDSLAERALLLQ